MSTYSIADATLHLAKLIDLALAGESVVITRRGRPVVALTPVQAEPVSGGAGSGAAHRGRPRQDDRTDR
jgi:prevent-host-death family protein